MCCRNTTFRVLGWRFGPCSMILMGILVAVCLIAGPSTYLISQNESCTRQYKEYFARDLSYVLEHLRNYFNYRFDNLRKKHVEYIIVNDKSELKYCNEMATLGMNITQFGVVLFFIFIASLAKGNRIYKENKGSEVA